MRWLIAFYVRLFWLIYPFTQLRCARYAVFFVPVYVGFRCTLVPVTGYVYDFTPVAYVYGLPVTVTQLIVRFLRSDFLTFPHRFCTFVLIDSLRSYVCVFPTVTHRLFRRLHVTPVVVVQLVGFSLRVHALHAFFSCYTPRSHGWFYTLRTTTLQFAFAFCLQLSFTRFDLFPGLVRTVGSCVPFRSGLPAVGCCRFRFTLFVCVCVARGYVYSFTLPVCYVALRLDFTAVAFCRYGLRSQLHAVGFGFRRTFVGFTAFMALIHTFTALVSLLRYCTRLRFTFPDYVWLRYAPVTFCCYMDVYAFDLRVYVCCYTVLFVARTLFHHVLHGYVAITVAFVCCS